MYLRGHRLCYQTIRYLVTCLTMSVILFLAMAFKIQNNSFFNLNIFQLKSDNELVFINQSSLTYNVERTEFYPHLPIQIYTKNRARFLGLKNKTKKIILLANPFFTDPTWNIKSLKNKTNSGNMSELFCSFLNNQCEITNDRNRFKQADAIVFHLRDFVNQSSELIVNRQQSQRFIFTLWESPINTPDLRAYDQFFNWSMTYRFDSHIFASYYAANPYYLKSKSSLKTIISDYQLDQEKIALYKNINITKKWGTAAALISNCGEGSKSRWLLVNELQKYMNVTVYGQCGYPCPETIKNETIDCRTYIAEHYYFLLSFENSYCHDYITEKFFSTISLPIIPVVFGNINYENYIPRSGFIDVRQFSSISELADRLNQIRNNLTLYQEYFKWKEHFIWNRFSDYMTPFCDLCLRLHLDTTPSIIDSVYQWWFHRTCQS